jgi:hypothetical protein
MVVTPYTDPGYGMPNPYIGNLNQAPGMAVGGYLLANQLMAPNQGQYQSPQNRLAPWSNFDANSEQPEPPEPLPGITSGPPRYGQDTSQLHWQRPPTWTQQLGNTRPADYNVDPNMLRNAPPAFRIWRGGTVQLPASRYPDTGEFWAERWRLPSPREQSD